MANNTNTISAALGMIFALQAKNPNRLNSLKLFTSDNEFTELVQSFLDHNGWSPIYGLLAKPGNDNEIKLAHEQHDAMIKGLTGFVPYTIKVVVGGETKSVIVDGDGLRATVAELKLGSIKPKFRTVDGHRRLSRILEINTILRKLGRPMVTEVPVTVENDMDEMGFVLKSFLSNRESGRKVPGLGDDAKAACLMVGLGANESLIRRISGSGQKLFEFASIRNEILPTGRDLLTELEEGKINLTQLDATTLRNMRKGNPKLSMVPKSVEERVQYVTNPPSTTKTPAMMNRAKVEQLANSCPVGILRAAFRAVLENNGDRLAGLVGKAQEINAVTQGFIS
jgi:hypothetical protein